MAKLIRKQSTIENLVQDLTDLRNIDTGLQSQIGNLDNLTTDTTSNLVSVINELELNSNSIDTRLRYIEELGGVFDVELLTDDKTVLGAINENHTRLHVNDGLIEELQTYTGLGIPLDTLATDLSTAINEIHTQTDSNTSRIVDLEDLSGILTDTLNTTATTIVGAVNEVNNQADSNTNRIVSLEDYTGIPDSLDTSARDLSGGINEIHSQADSNTNRIVSLEDLTGINVDGNILDTESQDLIASINEIHSQVDSNTGRTQVLEDLIGLGQPLDTDAINTIDAINEIHYQVDSLQTVQDNEILRKDDNLASLLDKVVSRDNLDVYARAEVEQLIRTSEINLGTNYSVGTLLERDTLIELSVGDNIYVENDGDEKWAIYKVTEITDGNGNTSSYIKIMDQDIYLNAISKEAIKSAYESNDDTNAFTDDEQRKVSLITITEPIDLDKVIQKDELNTSLELDNASYTDIPSSFAVKSYINNKNVGNLKVSNNLSDLDDVSQARTNLDVYTKDETYQLIIENAQGGGSGEVTNEAFNEALNDIKKMKKNYFFGLDLLGKL